MNEQEKALGHRALSEKSTALIMLLCGIGLGLLNLYFGTGKYGIMLFLSYLKSPLLVALNTLPYILLILILWMLCNRSWIAFIISSIICLGYSWASYWKLMARSDPIYAEDLAVIKDAAKMSGQYISITLPMIISVIIVAAVTVFLFKFCKAVFPARTRILGLILSVCVCVGAYFGIYTNADIYSGFPARRNLNQWIECDRYMSRGSIYPFIYSIKSAISSPPDDYDRSAVQNLLESYRDSDIDENKKVSVICYMMEAFSDLSDCTDKIDGTDPYNLYHQLCSESYTGRLIDNVFAGNTINTERCVLTGMYKLGNFRRSAWSYARYFSDQGYSLVGGHPGNEMFYNRSNVNRNLGFDNYLFYENCFSELSSEIAKDNIFVPKIWDLCLEEINEGKHVFSYNVTYQNHGPYSSTEKNFSTEYVSLTNAGSEESYYIINNYLAGIESTAGEFYSLTRSINETKEPVILVLFGDHKPWLGEQNSVYEALGIDLSSNNDEAFYNYYSTEYLIWANDAAKETLNLDLSGAGPDISPCFLMNVLFDLCSWDGPAYKKYNDYVMDILPVISSNNKYMENGRLVTESELSEKAKELLNEINNVHYYLIKDYAM